MIEDRKKIDEEEEDWCDRCEKRYIWLEDHMKTEHGIKFNCEQCEDDFMCEEELEEHMKVVHRVKFDCM